MTNLQKIEKLDEYRNKIMLRKRQLYSTTYDRFINFKQINKLCGEYEIINSDLDLITILFFKAYNQILNYDLLPKTIKNTNNYLLEICSDALNYIDLIIEYREEGCINDMQIIDNAIDTQAYSDKIYRYFIKYHRAKRKSLLDANKLIKSKSRHKGI
jgi:hypothetical protein